MEIKKKKLKWRQKSFKKKLDWYKEQTGGARGRG